MTDIIFRHFLFVIFSFILGYIGTGKVNAAMPQKEWTVLIYVNGKNNLETNALDNFHSMAEVGSSSEVNFVVQLGRPKNRYTDLDGAWSGVRRFFVKKGAKPIPSEAVADVSNDPRTSDLGRPAALTDFIQWGKREYPAKKYMLIIWNHGQGWRFQLARSAAARSIAATSTTARPSLAPESLPLTPPILGGYRAVSNDDDTGSVLFNKEVQNVVEAEFREKPLDLLGFDACLMSMVETAYAFAPSTKVMVSSEELEPADGWRYSKWMDKLVAQPGMSAKDLARAVVDMYRDEYGNTYLTTLSSIDLEGFRESAHKLSVLADAVRAAGKTEIANFKKARGLLKSYGSSSDPLFRTSVDTIELLTRYEAITKSEDIKTKLRSAREAMQSRILANYASTRSADGPDRAPYGSHGLAIYLPESKQAFWDDPYRKAYMRTNEDRPVDFVKAETWSLLVADFVK